MYFRVEYQSLKYYLCVNEYEWQGAYEFPSHYEDITAVCFSLQSSFVDHPPSPSPTVATFKAE